jgi:DNA ligase-1
VKLCELVETSKRVGETRSRNEKVQLIAECLRHLSEDELAIGVSWLIGTLPQRKIGVGWGTLRAAGVENASAATLTLREVDAAFARLALVAGRGSGAERSRALGELFARATAEERDFLRRLLLGELRQGAEQGVVLDAIARAAGVEAAAVRRACMLLGDAPSVAHAALTGGAAALGEFRLQLFRPIEPMLAQTAADPAEALERLGRAAFEHKLDGARVQVHREGNDVRVFSRLLNDVTGAVPELVAAARSLPAHELVLDGEAIALRPDGTPQPFVVTMRRFGRKRDDARLRAELPLSTFFFDCLHVDGVDLLDLPAEERMAHLDALAPAALRVARRIVSTKEEAESFFADALRHGQEGLVAKALAAPYEAGRRGASWLKLKPAHSLDLVVLAAEWGSGRRRGWLSNLHLGARDTAGDGFVMLGKTFKGMTDAMLVWQTAKLLELEVTRDGHIVYVRPELVVEVAFDGVQQSSQYPGGVALRFARIKRYREDKRADQADTIDAVRGLARA